ncbi:Copper-exporting P-type ATPase [Sporomusa silvacetica DSM 10669]|uniref:Copper chaperone CopZ n=1 Tax=Sporomusa silvacetica DSM 10669 TaxID=1123289 RepID=A0ABZ3IH77_9FIRM|nr:heavy metal-associated domain-containing protein [Sporomusa silvacetica]OZC14856.1 copper-exporting P-type ATPase A [Sporomusa silvacetica DSM 10669]
MTALKDEDNLYTSTVKIDGMSCAACAVRIEKGLLSLAGVKKAGVNLATENAAITYEPNVIGLHEISGKIEKLGFQVDKAKVDLKINGMSCAACSTRLENGLNKLSGVYNAVVDKW